MRRTAGDEDFCVRNRVKLRRKCKVHSHFDFIIAIH